jgi:YHS domain-containing protein
VAVRPGQHSAVTGRLRYPEGMVTDPVCGMRLDPDDAVATVEHDGVTYYFCSEFCRDAFVADPAAYIS